MPPFQCCKIPTLQQSSSVGGPPFAIHRNKMFLRESQTERAIRTKTECGRALSLTPTGSIRRRRILHNNTPMAAANIQTKLCNNERTKKKESSVPRPNKNNKSGGQKKIHTAPKSDNEKKGHYNKKNETVKLHLAFRCCCCCCCYFVFFFRRMVFPFCRANRYIFSLCRMNCTY